MTGRLSNAELLGRLVGFDSTSRNSNLPIADFICDYLDGPGVRIHRHPSSDGDKANLVISLGPADARDRRGLVLSGHMDVVPADEPDWHGDPFELTEENDAYVGRGACDMKGFLALAMNTAVDLDPATLEHPLVLVLTYDEELGTLGAKHLVDTWTDAPGLPKNAIIGEPTSLNVVRMHKGHLQCRVTLTGKGAHSGYPHLGQNAIEPAGRLIAALSDLRRTLEAESPPHREHFPEVPYVAMNLARIAGGVAINVVPDQCVLDMGIRLLPEMDSAAMIDRVRSVVSEAVDGHTFAFEVPSEAPPMILDEDARIYRVLCAEVGQQETLSVSYATDAGWLRILGLDCAIFGPGSIEVAHKANESLPISEFDSAAEMIEHIVRRFCLAAN